MLEPISSSLRCQECPTFIALQSTKSNHFFQMASPHAVISQDPQLHALAHFPTREILGRIRTNNLLSLCKYDTNA